MNKKRTMTKEEEAELVRKHPLTAVRRYNKMNRIKAPEAISRVQKGRNREN